MMKKPDSVGIMTTGGRTLYITNETGSKHVSVFLHDTDGNLISRDDYAPDVADVIALRFSQMAKMARGKK